MNIQLLRSEINSVNVRLSAESCNPAVLGVVKCFTITEPQVRFSFFDFSLYDIYKYSNITIVEELLRITELYR